MNELQLKVLQEREEIYSKHHVDYKHFQLAKITAESILAVKYFVDKDPDIYEKMSKEDSEYTQALILQLSKFPLLEDKKSINFDYTVFPELLDIMDYNTEISKQNLNVMHNLIHTSFVMCTENHPRKEELRNTLFLINNKMNS